MSPSKAPTDWERIEADYRAGILSTREMAGAHGVSHTAINKRAKAQGWTRDLKAKIKAKADALVSRQAVSAEVSTGNQVSERVLIEANASVIAQIRSQHRADIGRSRSLCTALLAELESQTGNLPGLIELGTILRKEDDRGIDKLNDIYQAVISLPERTKTMKALAETLKHLIGLEREAYDIAPLPAQVAVTTPADGARKLRDLTDDELLAIAAGGGSGSADPASS